MTVPPRPVALARRLLARPIDPAAQDVVELAAWVVRKQNGARADGVHETPATAPLLGHLHLLTDSDSVTRWAFQDGRYSWTDRWGLVRTSAFGTRLLRSGDHLTIHPDDVDESDVPPAVTTGSLWSGVVALPTATGDGEDVEPGAAMGIGTITWRGWFLRRLPAELRPA